MLTWWNLRRLRSRSHATRQRAKRWLIARIAVDPLIVALDDPLARPDAIDALRQIGALYADYKLKRALKHPNQNIRTGAALARQPDADSTGPLLELLHDDRGELDERELGAVMLAALRHTDALLQAATNGNPHSIAGIWACNDDGLFVQALDRLSRLEGPVRDSMARALGKYPYERLMIETYNRLIWESEESEWLRALGEALLSLPRTQRSASFRALLHREESGVVYGRGHLEVLSEGNRTVLAAALLRVRSPADSGGRESLLSHLSFLALATEALRADVALAIKRISSSTRR